MMHYTGIRTPLCTGVFGVPKVPETPAALAPLLRYSSGACLTRQHAMFCSAEIADASRAYSTHRCHRSMQRAAA